jgi:hypothetical protein
MLLMSKVSLVGKLRGLEYFDDFNWDCLAWNVVQL